MNIEAIVVGPFEVNCYLIWKEGSSSALVVDPGEESALILRELERRSLTPAAYLLTHGHADHLGAVEGVSRKYPAPAYISKNDAVWAFSPANQIPPYYDVPAKPASVILFERDEQSITQAGLTWLVLETPGHSPGGVCFYFPESKVLISGDTLFQSSVGRTDLPGGDARTLTQSLKKLAQLPPDTVVYPGHGGATTIREEQRNNYFFRFR
jgi:hydroxyacylglutathione hydrolase